MNTFVLSGFACNGKSSLIPALRWHLKSLSKKVLVVKEPVGFGFQALNFTGLDEKCDTSVKQATFISASLAQLQLIQHFMNQPEYVILCDRSIIDVLIFTYLHSTQLNDVNIESKILSQVQEIQQQLGISILTDMHHFYLLPPKNPDILASCMERSTRKRTIGHMNYHEVEKKFRKVFLNICKDATVITHPADNTYILYKILEKIVSLLEQ